MYVHIWRGCLVHYSLFGFAVIAVKVIFNDMMSLNCLLVTSVCTVMTGNRNFIDVKWQLWNSNSSFTNKLVWNMLLMKFRISICCSYKKIWGQANFNFCNILERHFILTYITLTLPNVRARTILMDVVAIFQEPFAPERSSSLPDHLIKFSTFASCVHTAKSHSDSLESCNIQLGLSHPQADGWDSYVVEESLRTYTFKSIMWMRVHLQIVWK